MTVFDPFRIEGPAVIKFSGGRTSGYMLWRILKAHGGKLPDDVFVSFQNTGKEMHESLDFIDEVERRWNVPILWLEWQPADDPADRWKVIDYATAARAGEPFAALIRDKGYLPNPATRFCTSELKAKTTQRYIRAVKGWDAWTAVVGIRADEPIRAARISTPNRDRDERYAPLAVAGIGVRTVGEFWRAQPFDLRLPNMNGRTTHGNCDLCFLKQGKQVESLIRERPERALWWIAQEQAIKTQVPSVILDEKGRNLMKESRAMFRIDRPTYAQMHRNAVNSGELFDFDDDALIDCACTD